MTDKLYPGVQKVKRVQKDGTCVVHYYLREPRTKLPGKPGDLNFDLAYARATKSSVSYFDKPTTFGMLVLRYLQSDDFKELGLRTQEEYQRSAFRLRETFGDMPVVALDDSQVRQDFKTYQRDLAKETPRAADHDISVLSKMLNFAIDNSWLNSNFASKMPKFHKSDRSENYWVTDQINTFLHANKSRSNGFEICFALVLAVFTGQRLGDLIELKWEQIEYEGPDRQPVGIWIRQSKGQNGILVPFHKDLMPWLGRAPQTAGTILCTSRGSSWTASGLKTSWKKAKKRGGPSLDNVRFHDLRGTAVVRLAEAGCTIPEIASITGHSLRSVDRILEVYYARTGKQARNAVRKLEASDSMKDLQLQEGMFNRRK